MKKTIKTLLLATSCTLALTASSFAAELTEERVNEMIKDYIYNNPKVIIEALQQWQIQEEASRLKGQEEAIASLDMKVFESNHYPKAGNLKGDATVIEFFDYNCPACKMMFESLDTVMKEDKNLRVVFVEYPIFGPQSDTNAKLGLSVYALYPDKYFDFHTGMMRSKGKMDEAMTLMLIKNLGMDEKKVKAESEKEKYAQILKDDRDLAKKLQIQGTPAVIVGTKLVNSALEAGDLRTHIRWARTPDVKE